ncbi:MAG TPA: type II toxin-antitoxin system VapC family toxin [Steroidobacteraceae bacterium]|jgi:PIN domain nuclease of toxin-antitoxin system|nr:type II toxin-antitoxin system VapC family toxin [Steroidobacteraceae bacterium]
MRLLLDTHVFLWTLQEHSALTAAMRKVMDDAEEVHVSAASIWEIAIKARLKKIRVDADALSDAISAGGFEELPVRAVHALGVATLPPHHADPFDRLLIAQALYEPLVLLTADKQLSAYGDRILLVK